MQEENGGSKSEDQIGWEGKKGGGIREKEREGEDEEEEEDSGGLERGEAVDGGAAFEERVGIRGDDELVEDGDEEEDDDEVKREVAEAVGSGIGGGGRRERVEWFGGVGMREFEVAAGGGD